MFAPTVHSANENNVAIWSAAWLSTQDIAVGSIDGSTRILTPTLETKFNLQSQHMGIVSMASNLRESIFVTNSLDGNICLRSSRTGELLRNLSLGPMESWKVFLSSDNVLFTGNGNGIIKMWKISGNSLESCGEINTNSGFVMSLAVSADGELLACGHKDGTINLVSVKKSSVVRSIHDHSMPIRCLCFSASKLLYAGCDDTTISRYDCQTDDCPSIGTYCNHTGWVTGVDVSADEKYLVSWWGLGRRVT